MSILIKGMEMPTSCAFCRFNGAYCYAKGDEDAHSTLSCPLIPIPAHGRLIDADELWKAEKGADALHKLRPMRPKGESVIYDAGFLAGYRAAAQIASKMPTIIPADKDGDGNG